MILLRSYARIIDVFNAWFGTNWSLPIYSFGFFVALAFLIGGYVLVIELKRKEKLGLLHPIKEKKTIGEPASPLDLFLNFALGFILGFKIIGLILNYQSFSQNPQTFIFSSEGNIIAGIIVGTLLSWLKFKEKKQLQLPKPEQIAEDVYPHQRVGDIVTIAAISGILGAKIFSNFEEENGWQNFLADPMGNFFSGLTIYGGLLLGAACVLTYARIKKINWLHLGDAIAPVLILAYGIGRIGCQVSGDGDWGIYNSAYSTDIKSGSVIEAKPGQFDETLSTFQPYFVNEFGSIENVPHANFKAPRFIPTFLVAQNFAHNVNHDGYPMDNCDENWCTVLPIPVFPTSLYETIFCVLIFLALWYMRNRVTIPGMLFAFYIAINGFERFFIEKVRVNNELTFLGIKATQAEFISFALMVFGLVFMAILWQKSKRKSGLII